MKAPRRWLVSALALALAACDGAQEPPDADADAAADADADADDDAGSDADADADADRWDADHEADRDPDADADADAAPRRRGGYVVATERATSDGGVESSVLARFYFPRPVIWCGYDFDFYGDCYIVSVLTPLCEPACEGDRVCAWNADCSLASCVDPVDPAALFDAGDVAIEGAAHQGEVTCAFASNGYECDVDPAADFWDAGDALLVSAPGATFPGFAVDVIAPPPISITSDTSAWTPETFDGSGPVAIEWDATGGADAIEIGVGTEATDLTCLTNDTGSFEIPAAALAALGGGDTYTVTIVRSNGGIDHEAGDGEVKVYVESAAPEVVVE